MSYSIEFTQRDSEPREGYYDPSSPEAVQLHGVAAERFREGTVFAKFRRLARERLDTEIWIVQRKKRDRRFIRVRRRLTPPSVTFPVVWELFAFLLP